MSEPCLTHAQIEAANLVDWRPIIQALQTRFRTGDFATPIRRPASAARSSLSRARRALRSRDHGVAPEPRGEIG